VHHEDLEIGGDEDRQLPLGYGVCTREIVEMASPAGGSTVGDRSSLMVIIHHFVHTSDIWNRTEAGRRSPENISV
jgi:hypothetical protein